MVDYDRYIGGDVTLRIRDYGRRVEFWIIADRYTWNYSQPWSWHVNGADGSGTFRLEKSGLWQRMGIFDVTADQDVRFSVQNSGLGFPTYDFWQHINRITVPAAPSPVYYDTVLDTSLIAHFDGRSDGGSTVLEWQLVYGTNPYSPTTFIDSGGTSAISGLTSGTTYYFWARGRNAVGWGPWSQRTQITTDRVPDSPNPVRLRSIGQTDLWTDFDYAWRWDGGSPILEWQIGYGLDPVTPQLFVTGVDVHLTGLQVAQRYYFWARARNALGWSPWSGRSEALLLAGAYISQAGIVHRAIPWVRDGGVWKVAKPWVKVGGIWSEVI